MGYIVGLDLGQPHEFTSLAVLERSTRVPKPQRREDWHYAIPFLRRFPIGTPYTEIVPAVLELINAPPLRGAPLSSIRPAWARPSSRCSGKPLAPALSCP